MVKQGCQNMGWFLARLVSNRSFHCKFSDSMASRKIPALRSNPSRSVASNTGGRVASAPSPPTRCGNANVTPSQSGTPVMREQIDRIEARLLLDHTVPGIDGVYIHEKALFDRLLDAQEKMSTAIRSLIK